MTVGHESSPTTFYLTSVTVSEAYNFTSSGEGTYSIRARNLFHYVDPLSNAVVPIQANSEKRTITLSGKLARPRSIPPLRKRSGFSNCDFDQQADLMLAAPAAQNYANDALAYVLFSC
jgi:peptidyl-Lys metalloendopeptidase